MEAFEFRIGRVMGRALRVLFSNLVPFLILTALAYSPAALSLAYMPQPEPLGPEAGFLAEMSAGAPAYPGLLEHVAGALLGAVVAYATFSSLQGTRTGLLDALGQGVRVILPVLGVSILTGICMGIGFVLLVVPGVILMCMWFVAVPAVAYHDLRVVKEGVSTQDLLDVFA